MTYQRIPNVRHVFGLTGAARHGKDAVAKMLVLAMPGAERFALSDAVAAECRVNHGMTTRDPALLQKVGMAWRESRPTVWLDALYGAISDRQPEVAIVTGVRFPDEAQLVRDLGGTIIRVVRRSSDGTPFLASDRDMTHRVESAHQAIAADVELTAQSGDVVGLARQLSAWLLGDPRFGAVESLVRAGAA